MVKMTFYLTFWRELAMMFERHPRALSKRARGGCRADRVTRNRVFEGNVFKGNVFEGNVFEGKKKPACVNTDGSGRGDAIRTRNRRFWRPLLYR